MLRETCCALAAPRRLVPLALVALGLASAEYVASGSLLAVAIDVLLLLAFALVGPALFRWARGRGALGFCVYALVALALVGALGGVLPRLLGLPWTYLGDPPSLGVVVILFLVGGWGLGRDIELERSVLREQARADRLRVEAEHAQLLALRAQLDPHFLFNTLNAIAEWCREDPEVAERATLELAGILRVVFDALRAPRWSLGDEVALLEKLASLYRARDEERYAFRFDVEPSASNAEGPSRALLPLFENAIKHGPSAGHRGAVELAVRDAADGLTITIANPGPFRGLREGGHGVGIVTRRLALTYGDAGGLAFEDGAENTAVRVRMPRRIPS